MTTRVRNLQPCQQFRLKRTGDLYELLGHKRDTPSGTQYIVRRSGLAKPSTPHHACHADLRKALVIAEAALADIGDADCDPDYDLAWCEARAAQALPEVRAALASAPAQPAPATQQAGEVRTCKQDLQVAVWVMPDGKGGGQFSWEAQDERFWVRLSAPQPSPTAQAAESVLEDAARYRYLRDGDWRENDKLESIIRLQLNSLWDAAIDAARAAQEGQA